MAGEKINEFVSLDDLALPSMSVDVAVQSIQLFDDPYISKQDIASAFTHIIVHHSDWHLLGFKWQNNYYFSMCLFFGYRTLLYLYNEYVDALGKTLLKHKWKEISIFIETALVKRTEILYNCE